MTPTDNEDFDRACERASAAAPLQEDARRCDGCGQTPCRWSVPCGRRTQRRSAHAASPQPAPAPVQVDDALGRFGHHPDPATDFEVEVTSLQGRLFNAKHAIPDKHGLTESVAQVADAIKRAMTFRVGGVETSVRAKSILRALELDATQPPAPAPVQPAFQFLCGGARFKLAAGKNGAEFRAFPHELSGQWVALVDASDDRHMKAAHPPAPATASGGDAAGHIAMLRSLRLMYDDGVMVADDHAGTVGALEAAIAALAVASEPEPDLDAYDPKSGELVAQWLFRNGFHELAAVVRAQLDMRAPRKAPPPLPDDTKRLDWLSLNPRGADIVVDGQRKPCVFWGVSAAPEWTLRQAIDAAMDASAARGEKGVGS